MQKNSIGESLQIWHNVLVENISLLSDYDYKNWQYRLQLYIKGTKPDIALLMHSISCCPHDSSFI